jgi:hypothetical protein
MIRHSSALFLVTGAYLLLLSAAAGQSSRSSQLGGDALRLLLSEVQPGTMSSEQYCLLVFQDKHFHAEKAVRKMGKDLDRKAYEGKLSDMDWTALEGILDSKNFRELYVAQSVPPPVVQESHTYSISVARGTKFQNLEFLDNKSRKPYESQLKPLLQWWKSVRRGSMREANVPPDDRCSLDNSHAIFTN